MFGAKIKKWIEIVNPRKKSSKNKNGNSSSQHSSNDYKSAVYQNEGNNISSPARRSEVSPIQYHNGRQGWQSPNQEIPSTSKLDCPPPVIKSTSNTATKSGSSLHSANKTVTQTNQYNNSNSNRTHSVTTTNYLTTAPTTFYQMKEIDQSMMQSNNPQVIVTSSKSTTSINSSNSNNNSIHYNNNTTTLLHPPPLYYSTSSSNELLLLDDNNPKTKYLISSSSSSVNSTTIIKNQNESNNNNVYVGCGKQNGNSESKYGKIQPINKYMNKYRFFSSKNTSSSNATSTSTIDRYNGNTSDNFCANITSASATLQDARFYSRKINNCDSEMLSNGPACNSIINNNEINERSRSGNLQNLKTQSNNSLTNVQVYRNGNNSNTNGLMYGGSNRQLHSSPHHQYQQQQQQQQVKHLTPNVQPSSTTQVHHHQQQQQQNGQNKLGYHVINHVSSPESAYSTGYSTDGNSPGGCSYSPDSYYINIRTGIHYFPKGNSILDYGNNRFKSDLNRIEEKNDETQFCHHTHKRTESFDCSKTAANVIPLSQHYQCSSSSTSIKSGNNIMPPCVSPGMSPVLRKNVIMATQFRTPSPRQRCRIRTNPWFSNIDPELSMPNDSKLGNTNNNNSNNSKINNNLNGNASSKQKRDRDSTGSTTSSSGIKSNSDESNEQEQKNKKIVNGHLTDSDSSSSTEKPSKTIASLADFRKKYGNNNSNNTSKKELPISISTTQQDGSDDDATLNEIGKFDESYVYEKENDIVSDSDRTDCVSDLGQEAGDECESTDDLLDVDFCEKESKQNADKKSKGKSMSSKKIVCETQQQQKKRKKFVRKRSKNTESNNNIMKSPLVTRGCRSVGGTPVSIRRNERTAERRQLETSLSNRSNSLTFNEIHMIHNRMLAISESEKALIKADLEADVKYRQLIHEAESILISMKSNLSTPGAQKDLPIPTTIASPRRQNVPTNKRVEMLRNCEVDLKRELAKTSNQLQLTQPQHPSTIINKRLEILRYETSMSAPSSPKTNRVAPVKTHVTNFIYQNEMDMITPKRDSTSKTTPIMSPRRFLAPKQHDDSDSESDVKYNSRAMNGKENKTREIKIKINPPMAQFRSVVCNNVESDDLFFPQSEPLKRKIYSCNSTIDKIQRSLDFDSDELPKKALLQKIQMLRNERLATKSKERESSSDAGVSDAGVSHDSPKRVIDENMKRKLIMKTIEDIKRSLEDQSLELNELHDSDT
ncbi:hypothetical protein ACKWTF_010049 [Chironomus riparius]